MTSPGGGGFRIARGFVEITGKVDAAKTKADAEKAGKEAGEAFEGSFGKHWEKQRRDARGRFVKGFDKDGHDAGVSAAMRFGAKFTETTISLLGKAAGPVGNALGGMFEKLPPQAQAAIGAGVVAAVVMVAPLLAGVVSGAVVGAAGLGGIVGGIIIAAQHPAVKAAAKLTGQSLKETFTEAGAAFVPAVEGALGQIRTEFREMGPELQGMFSGLARFVKPFTDGVIGMVRNLIPGFQAIADHGMPVIVELANWLPRLGTLLSDVFSMFADRSFEASRALQGLWLIFELGIRSIAGTIAGLSELYVMFEKLSFIARGDMVGLMAYVAQEEAAKKAGDELSPTLQEIIDGFQESGNKATVASTQIRDWLEVLREATGENLSVRAANRELQAAIDDGTKALKDNGATLDDNTVKGRANNAALDRLASAANAAYDATYKQTHSQEAASAAAAEGRRKFIELADKMGLTRAEAIRLADRLIGIPSVKRDVTVQTTKAQAAVQGIKSAIASINGRTVLVTVKYETKGRAQGEHIIGQGTQLKAGGGWVRGIGGDTDDKNPALLSRDEFVLRARAARRLTQIFGPEFLPMLNEYDRSVGTGSKHPMLPIKRTEWAERADNRPASVSVAGGDGASAGPTVVQIDRVDIHVDSADLEDMQRVLDLFESLPTTARQYSVTQTTKAR